MLNPSMLTDELRQALDEAMRNEFCRIANADFSVPTHRHLALHPDDVMDAAEAHVIEEMESFIAGWRNRWTVENQSE